MIKRLFRDGATFGAALVGLWSLWIWAGSGAFVCELCANSTLSVAACAHGGCLFVVIVSNVSNTSISKSNLLWDMARFQVFIRYGDSVPHIGTPFVTTRTAVFETYEDRSVALTRVRAWAIGAHVAWLLAVCAAVAGVTVRPLIRRKLREMRGQCIVCGYYLCGNQSGYCPECGQKISLAVSGNALRNG